MTEPTLRRADAADRRLLNQLWTMFRHDMSEFSGALPNADGTFRVDRLNAAMSHPGWAAFIVELRGRPVGLALVRAIDQPVRVLSSFFIVRGARRGGIGLTVVHQLLTLYPGRWEVAFQPSNAPAEAFWRRVAASVTDKWTEEGRPVPGRGDLPDDTWISFTR